MANPDGRIPFEKILNSRDIGKNINHTLNSQLLHEGLIYRSARPDSATTSDRDRLTADLKIKTIIDLRTPTEHIEQVQKQHTEISSAPPIAPSDPSYPLRIQGINYREINFNGSNYSNALIWQLSYWNIAKLITLYTLGYRKEAISIVGANVMAERGLDGLATDSLIHCKAEVKQLFDVLCDSNSYPVVVHCTHGKDRTGLVVLLVLLLCGVPQQVIQSDYSLSESELLPEREEKLAENRSCGLPDSFGDCPVDWTSNVCNFINETHGGIGKYLESCGVTIEQQQALKEVLRIN